MPPQLREVGWPAGLLRLGGLEPREQVQDQRRPDPVVAPFRTVPVGVAPPVVGQRALQVAGLGVGLPLAGPDIAREAQEVRAGAGPVEVCPGREQIDRAVQPLPLGKVWILEGAVRPLLGYPAEQLLGRLRGRGLVSAVEQLACVSEGSGADPLTRRADEGDHVPAFVLQQRSCSQGPLALWHAGNLHVGQVSRPEKSRRGDSNP